MKLGHVRCGFELLAEVMVVEGESLDVGDGQVEVFGESVVGAPEVGYLLAQRGVVVGVVSGGWWCRGSSVLGDVPGGVGEISPEGGVGQSEVAGQGQDAGPTTGGMGFGEDVGLGLFDGIRAGEWDSSAHGVGYLARNWVISWRRPASW